MLFTAWEKEILDGTNVAVVGTITPNGQPHLAVVWIMRDSLNDTLVFTTKSSSQKFRNLETNNRISVLVYSQNQPNVYVEVRGKVSLDKPVDNTMADAIAYKYTGIERPANRKVNPDTVIVRIHPKKVFARS